VARRAEAAFLKDVEKKIERKLAKKKLEGAGRPEK
jgi:hypothetical protein